MTKATRTLRNALSHLRTRQCLVFLFFLFLSTSFWFFQALNETYEEEFDIPVDIKKLPNGVVITSDVPGSMRVLLKDRGVTLLNYKYGDKIRHITIETAAFSGNEGHVRLLAADIVRQLRPSLAQGTQILSVKPDTLEIFYNHGRSKRVPIKMIGQPTAATGYAISGQRFSPDSVTVMATNAVLDTIRAVYLRTDHLRDLTASTTTEIALPRLRGAKFTPATTQLSVAVDRLVEKKLTLPIEGEGFPSNVQLRTFPTQVEVTFQVSMSLYRNITPDHFRLIVDYNQLPTDGSNHCRLILKSAPVAVSHVRLAKEEVEYVLETMHQ